MVWIGRQALSLPELLEHNDMGEELQYNVLIVHSDDLSESHSQTMTLPMVPQTVKEQVRNMFIQIKRS